MIRLTDGSKTVEITMNVWTGSNYSPDFSHDFFEVGNLPYDAEKDVYIVADVDYCVDYARSWENSTGDFADDEHNKNNNVDVIILAAF